MTDAALLAQAERQCELRGVRFTPIRRRVLELIATANGALKAYELLDRFAVEHTAARAPTIYRALDFLIEQGLVHRIESLNAYVACPCPEHAHGFQLLICGQCGRVDELHLDDVSAQLEEQARHLGFRIERQTIELLGSCDACLNNSTSADRNPTLVTAKTP